MCGTIDPTHFESSSWLRSRALIAQAGLPREQPIVWERESLDIWLTHLGEVLLHGLRSRLLPGGTARVDGLKAASDTLVPSGCLRFPRVSKSHSMKPAWQKQKWPAGQQQDCLVSHQRSNSRVDRVPKDSVRSKHEVQRR